MEAAQHDSGAMWRAADLVGNEGAQFALTGTERARNAAGAQRTRHENPAGAPLAPSHDGRHVSGRLRTPRGRPTHERDPGQ